MKKENEEYFETLADPILNSPNYQILKTFIQHGQVTTYDHCVRVARTAFNLNRALHAGAEEKELVEACLLHDYYLYDWHHSGDHLHGYHHPFIAAENASRDFQADQLVQEAIRTHMWPLNIRRIPHSKTGWLLTLSDKICSLDETLLHR